MTAQGLLVRGTQDEEYLLKAEPVRGTSTHRLMVLERVNGQWNAVEGLQELACREAMIGALVDFVVDLCRVLNSSEHQQASKGAPAQPRLSGGGPITEPALRQEGCKR